MEPETETTTQTKTIRIFISSPGDVAAERDKAKQVIAQLQKWYGPAVNLVPVLWEELPLEIGASFQNGIDVILSGEQGIDIAVFILWSRIGTPVTIGDKTYRSGTEREFDLMLHALEASGGERPDVVFYRRNDDDGFAAKLSDPENQNQLEKLIEQRNLAKNFLQENFWDEHGQNIRAYHSFHQPVEFAGRLKVHLQGLIDKRLEDSGLNREARWADVPYRGLEAFNLEHADIFFGREKEIVELESRLRDREHEEQPCAFVAVIGASGSGKSSLVRAGLRANLTRFNLDESISEWRSMVMMPGQAEGKPTRYLLECLTLPGALPELTQGGLSLDELAENLAESPKTTINLTIKPLMKGATAKAGPKLLVIVDQFEELFTDKRISAEDRDAFLLTLEALAQSGICWVVATMRSDFYPVAQKSEIFLRLKGQSGDGGHFDLLAPGPEALRRIITEPARMAGVHFEKRSPELGGQSVVGKILEDAREQPDMLPLLSDLLLELYQLRTPENLITFAAYESLGDENRTGLEGALSKRAEKEFAALSKEQQAACPEILHALVTVEADADVRRRASLEALRDTPQKTALVNAFIAARLLTADGPTVSLAHEALLRKWDRVADWVRDNRQHLRIRSRVEQAMRRWQSRNQHTSLLLPEGLDLEEGVSLLRDASHLVAGSEYEPVRSYITRSQQHHLARKKRSRWVRRAVIVGLLTLTGTAIWRSFEANQQKDESWSNEAKGWMLRADVAAKEGNRYPDTLLYAAQAIGFDGLGREEKTVKTLYDHLADWFPLVGSEDPYRRLWQRWDQDDVASYEQAHQWIAGRPGYRPVWSAEVGGGVVGLSASPHGRYLLVAGKEGSRRWDFSKAGEDLELEAGKAVAFHPGGERFAFADDSGVSIREKGKEISRYEEAVTALAYNLSGDFLAGARPDGTVILFREKMTELGKAGGVVTKLVFGPKDATLAAIVPGVGARLFFHHDRAPHLSWSKHAGEVTAIAYHPDPKAGRLALGTADGSISIWKVGDATKIAEIVPPDKHGGPVTGIFYSPDGNRIISCSEDGLVRLWDANADVPALRASLTGHVGPVRDVTFLPGGTLVASGGDDGTAKLWEVGDETKAMDLFSFVRDGWYDFEKETQETKWNKGSGFLNLSPGTLVGSWQSGKEDSWSDRWIEKGSWLSAGLVAPDPSALEKKLGQAIEEAKKAGEWNLARLRSGQMALLGLEAATLGNPVKDEANFTNGEGAEMIWCKPGKFVMGESDSPGAFFKHQVTLSHGFWLGKYEVTQELYEKVMGTNPSTNVSAGPKAPAENFSWHEAVEFCQKLTDLERSRGSIPAGWEYALPTEAMWEYAARAGTQTRWYFGDDETQLYKYGNFNDEEGGFGSDSDDSQNDGHEYTAPVGSYLPNSWGFHDMAGNVNEWSRDSFDPGNPNYPEAPVTDPSVSEGAARVGRGGSFDSAAARCRSAYRSAARPSYRDNDLGLRPALVPSSTGR